jgi:poly-gamma-glutamate capsule biosynthesis protein CapA/YwtB (metallophosphatase superfamily)
MERRLTLVLSLASLVVVAAIAALASRGGEGTAASAPAMPSPAKAPKAERSAAPLPAARAAARPAQARGRLGSGKRVTLAFGGDVHFEGVLASKLAASPATVLAPIAPALRRADIAVVNLETAVTTGGLAASKAYAFRAPASAFEALRGGGVTVASMANNHGLDFGETGLRDSLAAARRHRFPVIGIGLNAKQAYAPFRRTVNGQRVAIIGATQVLDDHLVSAWTAGPGKPGLASAKDVPRLLRAVRQARRSSDTVVVFLHWGVELMECPTSDQRTLARQLVAAGADVVVGGHAHRLQGAGRMGSALVGYGLGNFVWYGTTELSTRSGVLFVTATGRRIDGYRWEPARIVDGVPRPMTGAERQRSLSSWRALRGCTGLEP